MTQEHARFACDSDVAEDAIDKGLLRQAVENRDRMLWTLPLPLVVMCALAWGHPNFDMMAAICAIQTGAYALLWRANAKLRQALAAEHGIERAVRWKTASIALTGIIWGLALLPIGGSLTWGIAPMFIILTVVVCVAVSALMDAPIRPFSLAAILGFVAGGASVYLYFADQIGLMPAVSQLLLGPGLIWLTSAAGKHARKSMHNEIHNAQLALHLQSALDTAEYLSQHDSLTALLNRRAFEREAASFRGKSAEPQPAQIILFDLDHFKTINDSHGHSIGDTALKTVADTLDHVFSGPLPESFRHVWTARWGGEEFIVMLAGASSDAAWAMAEILRSAVGAARNKGWPAGLGLTASFGVSEWLADEPLHEAIARADEAMYRAKQRGRDCVDVGRIGDPRERLAIVEPLIARR